MKEAKKQINALASERAGKKWPNLVVTLAVNGVEWLIGLI